MYGLSNRSVGYGSRAFYVRLAVWCCALFFGFSVSAKTYAVVWYGNSIVTGVGSGWTSGTIHVMGTGSNEVDALSHIWGGTTLNAANCTSTGPQNPVSLTAGWACPEFCWLVGSPSWISNGHNYNFLGWVRTVAGLKGTYVANIGGSSKPISSMIGQAIYICSCCDRGYMLGGWDTIPYNCSIVNDAVVPPYLFNNPQDIKVNSFGGNSSGTIDSVNANTITSGGSNLVDSDGATTNSPYVAGDNLSFSNATAQTSASDLSEAMFEKFKPTINALGNAVQAQNTALNSIGNQLDKMRDFESAGNAFLSDIKANTLYLVNNIPSRLDYANNYLSTANSLSTTANSLSTTRNSLLGDIKTGNAAILSQLQTSAGGSGGSVDLSGVRSDVQAVKSSVDAFKASFDVADQTIPDDGGFVAPTDTGAADAQTRADAVSQQFDDGNTAGDSAIDVIGSLVGGLYGQWSGLGSIAPQITVAFNLPATGPFKGLNWSYHFDLSPYSELIGLLRKVEAFALWLFLAWKVRALLATLFD